MTDWLSDVRVAQAEVADEITRRFIASFGLPKIIDPKFMKGYVDERLFDTDIGAPIVDDTGVLDAGAFFDLVTHEANRGALVSVYGYADYVATQIIRSGRWDKKKLPIPHANVLELIARQRGVKPALLKFSVEQMRGFKRLPLLGRVRNGVLTPDKETLKKWKGLFDWSTVK